MRKIHISNITEITKDKIYYCDEPIDGRTYYVGLRYKF
jgi:hypothetical protein